MILLEPAPRLPFMDPRTLRLPGLQPLDPAEWITLDPDFAPQMAYRERLLTERAETVLGMTPEGEAPARELLREVAAHVLTRGWREAAPGRLLRPDGAEVALDAEAPMASLGRLVADDLCLLTADPASGEYRLAAAVLCFPSRWLLSEKLGRPLTEIHAPVPDYDAGLARRVNRVFEALRPDRPVWRMNWVVHPTAELFLPMGLSDKLMRRAAEAEGALYLRTERQTLRRLPETGAVAFGIKLSLTPLAALAPAEAAAMHAALGALDEATLAYRSGARVTARALAQLAEIAGQAEGARAS